MNQFSISSNKLQKKIIKPFIGVLIGLLSMGVFAQSKPVVVPKNNAEQQSSYPNYSLTDSRVIEFENLYIQSTQCEQSCGSLVDFEVKGFDEKTSLVEFSISYSASKKTILPLPISQNDFDILSVTNESNQNVPLLKKEKLYFLSLASDDVSYIKVLAKKKNPSQVSLLTENLIKVKSSVSNVSVQSTRNQFSIVFSQEKVENTKNVEQVVVKNDIKTSTSYMLDRVIILDTKWRMSSTLRPVSTSKNSNDVINFKVPMLQGEKILTSGIEVKDDIIDIKVKAGDSVNWSSELNPNEKLNVPSANGQFTQLVRIVSRDSWEISPEENSLKPVEINSDQLYKNGYSWFMWSQESLQTNVDLYKYLEGQTVAVSDLDMKIDMNTIPVQVKMSLRVNSSIGGIYKFKNKNKDFKIIDVNINQAAVQADVKNDEISLMLRPGINTIVLDFTYSPPESIFFKSPEFDFNTNVVNSSLTIEGGKNWILHAGGADVSPSVLLWSVLVTLLIFSIIISKSKVIDLSMISLVLLLFGTSQVGIDFVMLTLLWFFMIKYRLANTMHDFKTYNRFNAYQFGFAILTIFVISGMISVVAKGLLLTPESFIAGYQSSFTSLFWYSQEYSAQNSPWLLSVPIWLYRVLMMAWAVWLAFNMLDWLKSCWTAFSNEGFWYKKIKTEQKLKDENTIEVKSE